MDALSPEEVGHVIEFFIERTFLMTSVHIVLLIRKLWSADSVGWTGLKRPCIAWLVQCRACNNMTNLLCSEPTLSYVYITIKPWHQPENDHHPNMHKPQHHTCYISYYAYCVYHYYQLCICRRQTAWKLTQINMFIPEIIHTNVGTEYLNASMKVWHSDTLFQACYWKLPQYTNCIIIQSM